ncbi:hypothetical protein Bca52824_025851 [Brassica carinata]|uniref:Uncharacterized protein n=1 Tax=Brassica carinata TaxID=52824 RepID=A0A8X7SGZ3_BRACI|nr:hypothetical protein Bca52824_025851 [Brassica carinata]
MDGNMRRLPPWMLAGASSGVPATSNRTDDKSVVEKIKHEPEAPENKKKRKTRKERDDSDMEETKKVEIKRGRRGVGRKIKEEEAQPSIDDGKSPEMIQSVTSLEDEENLTVDDLLCFAQEYVKGEEEDQPKEIRLFDVNNESSKGETNGTRDPTLEDMINLLLGPFFKKSGTN